MTTEVPVIELYSETFGEQRAGSTPLLLLPGGGQTINTNWSAIMPSLTDGRQVIAVEMQGHGRSPDIDRPYTFENSAEDVGALLTRLDLGPVDVLGFSNGGNVGLRLAMRHPELVRRMIVASTFFRRDGMQDGFWEGMEAADFDSFPDVYREADRALNPDPAHQRRVFDLDTTQMRSFVDWDSDELRAIRAPTLFVAADQDVVRTEHVIEMTRLVDGARTLIVPATHGDFLGEALAAGEDLSTMRATVPWLLRFLDDGS